MVNILKDKLFKKRNHVNWYNVMLQLEDQRVFVKFNQLSSKSDISVNRLAYLAFKMVYSKAQIDYYRATSDRRIFTL